MRTHVTVADVLQWIDDLAPFRFAESWDHCGLQVGDPQEKVSGVLVALDPSLSTVQEAAQRQCQVLVVHHPLFFKPLTSIFLDRSPGRIVAEAIRHNVHIISAHTNLDAASCGTNNVLAQAISLHIQGSLENLSTADSDPRYLGLGLYGLLPKTCSALELTQQLAHILSLQTVRLIGHPETLVHKVALCTGSGMSLLGRAKQNGCDAFITGDVKYHDAQSALDHNIVVIDIGHFASEALVVSPLAEALRAAARRHDAAIDIWTSTVESDPFLTVIFDDKRRTCLAGTTEVPGGTPDS
ncbi:Nif3-like dinuclear metal center hexameric protein [Desulfosoma caldarium]|uniref:GTP cyclohydrolase 1 type 2 homolog n=1 Tax=Desulfosoma caldarium TaxID=610254 RepID=A0A3N1VID1_9BACT|nr:Nif3-like dinuclear metal center hexameric protein [Desulfosoma caldarium]ROR01660.1 dinuclear metal center YbgI/SA1388 family protein [Desulfosoma caldarium]